MPAGLIGYHPERIADLQRRVSAAVDDLRSLSSNDPAAADALGDVARARSRLETGWLQLLDRISASRAMLDPLDATDTLDPASDLSPAEEAALAAFMGSGRLTLLPNVPGLSTYATPSERARRELPVLED